MDYIRRSFLHKAASSRNITNSFAGEYLRNAELNASQMSFDIFLSHRFLDAREIYILAELIENCGLSVYIDWKIDPEMDRGKVTSRTALKLKQRMRQSRSLIFVTSKNSNDSKWMPWELGFMDARTSRVSILPVIDDLNNENNFEGQEYLEIYPKLRFLSGLFVELTPKTYTNYWTWLNE